MYMCIYKHERIVYEGEGCPCCEYLRQIKILQEHVDEMSTIIDKLESELFDFKNMQACPTKNFY